MAETGFGSGNNNFCGLKPDFDLCLDGTLYWLVRRPTIGMNERMTSVMDGGFLRLHPRVAGPGRKAV